MEHEYIYGKYNGHVVTDFDEQKTHFPDAAFSLHRIMDNQLDRAAVQAVVDTIGDLHPAPTYNIIQGNVEALYTGLIQVNNARADHGGLAKIVIAEGTVSSAEGGPTAGPGSGDTVNYIGKVSDHAQVTQGPHGQQNQTNTIAQHFPALIGIAFVLITIFLAFAFSSPTSLQTHVILAVLALGGGAFATEISGILKVDLTLTQKFVIGATGALAVFVILYFAVPAS